MNKVYRVYSQHGEYDGVWFETVGVTSSLDKAQELIRGEKLKYKTFPNMSVPVSGDDAIDILHILCDQIGYAANEVGKQESQYLYDTFVKADRGEMTDDVDLEEFVTKFTKQMNHKPTDVILGLMYNEVEGEEYKDTYIEEIELYE